MKTTAVQPSLKHEYFLTIRESDLDSFGHVNNTAYLKIFEEARWEMITSRGFGLKEIQEKGFGPIVLDVTIRFRKELRLREKIKVETHLGKCVKKIATILQEIMDESGSVCCRAEFTFALFDLKERKLISPTREWLHAIGFQGFGQLDSQDLL